MHDLNTLHFSTSSQALLIVLVSVSFRGNERDWTTQTVLFHCAHAFSRVL